MSEQQDLINSEVSTNDQVSDRRLDVTGCYQSQAKRVENKHQLATSQSETYQHPFIAPTFIQPIKWLCLILLITLAIIFIGNALIGSHNQLDAIHHSGKVHQFIEKHLMSMSKPLKKSNSKPKHKHIKKESSHKESRNKKNPQSTENLSDATKNPSPQTENDNRTPQKNKPTINSSSSSFPTEIYQNYQKYLELNYDEWKNHIDFTKYQPKAGITLDKFSRAIDKLLIFDYYSIFVEGNRLQVKEIHEKVSERNNRIIQAYKDQQQWFQSKYPQITNNLTNQPTPRTYNQSFCVIITTKTTKTPLIRAIHTILSFYDNQNPLNSTIVYSGVFTNPTNHQTFKKVMGFSFPQTSYVYEQKGFKAEFINAISYQTKTQIIYHAVHEHCHEGQFVLLVDQGDAIVSRYLISVLAEEYQRKLQSGLTPLMVYTQNILTDSVKHQFSVGNSNFYQEQFFVTNNFRKLHKLNVAPLVSFKRQLFLRIDPNDFKSKSGKFYEKITQQAIVYPLLQMSGSRIKYIEQIMYQVFDQRTERERKRDSVNYKKQLVQFYSEKTPYQKISNVELTNQQLKQIKQRYQLQKQAYKQSKKQQTQTLINQMRQQMSIQRQKLAQSHSHNHQQEKKQVITSLPLVEKPNKNQTKDLYNFNVSVNEMIDQARQRYYFQPQKNIAKKQLEASIKRMWINHRVDINGMIVDNLHSQLDLNSQRTDQSLSTQQIIDTIEQQYTYFDTKYNISKFHSVNKQLPVCIVIPSYQNAQDNLLYRNLDSIFMQNYSNYHVVYVEDHSPDNTGRQVLNYITKLQIPQSKIKVIINENNFGAMYSIYHGITDHCADNQIVVMVDGDDALIGRQVLAVVNAVFQQENLFLLYSQYVKLTQNSKVSIGTCHPFAQEHFAQNSFRTVQDARVSHLKVFYAKLFKQIKIQDVTYDGKRFYQAASDRAILTPMLEMANPRFRYLPQILYEYRYDTGINGNLVHKSQQRYVKNLIQKKPKYQPIDDLKL